MSSNTVPVYILLFISLIHLSRFTFLASSEADLHRSYNSYNTSVDSHASIPSISPFADAGAGSNEPYPAWGSDKQIPMSTEEIEDIFLDLTQKFGFQRDSMRNMVCFSSFHPLSHVSPISSSILLCTFWTPVLPA